VLLCNNFCRGKAINISYCECVFVALVIQHAKCMRRITCHLWPVWLYHVFPHYLIMARFSGKKNVIEYKMWVLIFSTRLSKTYLILGRIQRDMIMNVSTYSCTVLVIPVIFNEARIFSTVIPNTVEAAYYNRG
jgi:hypothetical protein